MKRTNNNFSVLPFYNDLNEQNHRKSYAYGAVYPLYAPKNVLLPFQVMRNKYVREVEEYVDIEAVQKGSNRWALGNVIPQSLITDEYYTNEGTSIRRVEAIRYCGQWYEIQTNKGYAIRGLQTIGDDLAGVPRVLFGGTNYGVMPELTIFHDEPTEIIITTPSNGMRIWVNNKLVDGDCPTEVLTPTQYINGSNATFTIDSGKRYRAKVDELAVAGYPLAIFFKDGIFVGEQSITAEQLGTFVELDIPEGANSVLLNSNNDEVYAELQRIDIVEIPQEVTSVELYTAKGELIADITEGMTEAGLQIVPLEDMDVILFPANVPVDAEMPIGQYYLKMSDEHEEYYSEVFTLVEDIAPYLKIEWWDVENLVFDSGIIIYDTANFKNIVYLCTELGKPDYQFEEEGETRNGYFFPQKQISEKTYKATILAPEYLCDVMRFIRMADYVQITDKYGRRYNADTFLITPKWQTQGDLASVEIEFETDTVVKKIGKGYTI